MARPNWLLWQITAAEIRYAQEQQLTAFRDGMARGQAMTLVIEAIDARMHDPDAPLALLADIAALPYNGELRLAEPVCRALRGAVLRRERVRLATVRENMLHRERERVLDAEG